MNIFEMNFGAEIVSTVIVVDIHTQQDCILCDKTHTSVNSVRLHELQIFTIHADRNIYWIVSRNIAGGYEVDNVRNHS